jgi:hypothetical protein
MDSGRDDATLAARFEIRHWSRLLFERIKGDVRISSPILSVRSGLQPHRGDGARAPDRQFRMRRMRFHPRIVEHGVGAVLSTDRRPRSQCRQRGLGCRASGSSRMVVETPLCSALLSAQKIFDEYLRSSNCVLAIITGATLIMLIAPNRPPPPLRNGREDRVFDASMFQWSISVPPNQERSSSWLQTMTSVCWNRQQKGPAFLGTDSVTVR